MNRDKHNRFVSTAGDISVKKDQKKFGKRQTKKVVWRKKQKDIKQVADE